MKLGEVFKVHAVHTCFNVSEALLANAFVETDKFQDASSFEIYHNESGFWPLGFAQITENNTSSFGITLEMDEEGGIYLVGGGSTQSCTSQSGCKGCKLTVIDNYSGYCDCVASDVWVDPSRGKCQHSISQEVSLAEAGGKREVVLTELISKVNELKN